jgi:predicted LPLAT superfamily acyltransferase
MSEPGRWTQVAEVGTTSALRFAGWFHRSFGRRPSVALAALSAAYFCATNGAARRASSRYLARMAATPEGRKALGGRPKALLILRHFVEIAISVYDRIVVWSGAVDTMDLEHDNSEKLFELAAAGQGALLLGAHLGNLDMMSFIAAENDLRMNVVVYNENAARINDYLDSLDGPKVNLIELRPGSVQAAFEIRACLARGEFVAIMADRTPPHSDAPTARFTFLGHAAPFPLGPFRLASALGCHVYFVLCVRTSGARYRTILRTISAPESVAKGERRKNADELLGRYVGLLEEFCQRYPLQWFNFYDFWDERTS